MNVGVMLPVKSLQRVKARLAPVLSVAERSALVQRLLLGQLAVLAGVAPVSDIVVISRDPIVRRLAADHGAHVFRESAAADLNGALSEAARAWRHRVTHLLVMPVDLPFLRAADVARVLDALPDAALCADRHGSGTNALLLPADDLIPFQFGDHSFFKHRSTLQAFAIPHQIIDAPGVRFDVDTPADYAIYAAAPAGGPPVTDR